MAIRDRDPAEINVVAPVSAAQLPPRQVARDAQPGAGREGATTVPIEGVSARLLARMNESLGVPTATSFREIDVATLEAERSRLNATLAPLKLFYTHLLAFAVAQAVAVHPEMAAFYREIEGRPHRVEPARVGLGWPSTSSSGTALSSWSCRLSPGQAI